MLFVKIYVHMILLQQLLPSGILIIPPAQSSGHGHKIQPCSVNIKNFSPATVQTLSCFLHTHFLNN